ncbi:hypothetical protein V492_03301, partial [Pseudogymnoascus sp. VKM F-4246]
MLDTQNPTPIPEAILFLTLPQAIHPHPQQHQKTQAPGNTNEPPPPSTPDSGAEKSQEPPTDPKRTATAYAPPPTNDQQPDQHNDRQRQKFESQPSKATTRSIAQPGARSDLTPPSTTSRCRYEQCGGVAHLSSVRPYRTRSTLPAYPSAVSIQPARRGTYNGRTPLPDAYISQHCGWDGMGWDSGS